MALSTSSLIIIIASSLFLTTSIGYYYVYHVPSRSPVMMKKTLRDAESLKSLCNDGSEPVYYVNINPSSNQWLFYLQGGGGCYNEASCKNRLETQPNLMTSKLQPEKVTMEGFMSTNCYDNPAFCEASHVYIHYCSSDQWTGNYSANTGAWPWSTPKSELNFHGSNIVSSVVAEVMKDYNEQMKKATRVTLSGVSAGGMGCIINGDRVGDQLHDELSSDKQQSQRLAYHVIPDSGWFNPGPSLKDYPCDNTNFCNIEERTKLGVQLWSARVNDNCRRQFGSSEQWKCMFLPIDGVLESFKYPMMNVFYKYDIWQIVQDGILQTDYTKFTKQQLQWVQRRGQQSVDAIKVLKDKNTKHGIFMIECVFHVSTLLDNQISSLTINGKTMSQVIKEWFQNPTTADSIVVEDDCDGSSSVECNSNCPSSALYNVLTEYGKELYPSLSDEV